MANIHEQVYHVSIDDIENIKQAVYTDGDIAFVDDMCDLPQLAQSNSIRMDMIVFLFCTQGKVNFNMGTQSFTVHTDELLCGGPEMSFDDIMFSPDFKAKILCVSTSIIHSLVHTDKNILNHYFSRRTNPVISIDETGKQLIEYYYSLLKFRLSLPQRVYYKEAVASLVSAALYDMLGELGEPPSQIGSNSELITQGDMLFQRFIELLTSTNPKPRSVAWYGKQLCVTPKYLSTVVKQSSGKTALKWITDYVVQDIRRLLGYSNISIKEIADTLNFPNISFFGKYTKQHLGCSPTEYRRKMAQ